MEIWIGRNGERNGPYAETDVRQWLRDGQVGSEDLGWYEGLTDWQPLGVLFPEDNAGATGTGTAAPPPIAARPLPQTTTASLEDYAGFWKRVGAYLIDAVVLYLPNLVVQRMMGSAAAEAKFMQAREAAGSDFNAAMVAMQQYYHDLLPALLVISVITWLYFALCESSAWQGTLGKLALGIRVTDMQGARISLPRALGRYPAKYLSAFIFCIGFLMVAWTSRKQGLHDLIAGTLVLNGRAREFKHASSTPAGQGGSFSA